MSTNSNDHIDISSVVNSGVGTQVQFPPTFGSKDELDSFLRFEISSSSKQILFLRMTSDFKIIMKLLLMERVQTTLSTIYLL